MTQLSKADRERIEAAVQRAEAETSTEIVVAIVARSSSYRFHRLLGAFAWTLAAQLLLARSLEAHTFWLVLGAATRRGVRLRALRASRRSRASSCRRLIRIGGSKSERFSCSRSAACTRRATARAC